MIESDNFDPTRALIVYNLNKSNSDCIQEKHALALILIDDVFDIYSDGNNKNFVYVLVDKSIKKFQVKNKCDLRKSNCRLRKRKLKIDYKTSNTLSAAHSCLNIKNDALYKITRSTMSKLDVDGDSTRISKKLFNKKKINIIK